MRARRAALYQDTHLCATPRAPWSASLFPQPFFRAFRERKAENESVFIDTNDDSDDSNDKSRRRRAESSSVTYPRTPYMLVDCDDCMLGLDVVSTYSTV